MFNKKTVGDIDIKDKVVLLRADYNVPMKDGEISDDLRIRASLPTLEYLLTNGVKSVIIISHLGRPKGKEAEFSLSPVAERLGELMPGTLVEFCPETVGEKVKAAAENLPKGGVLLLENLRFYPEEKQNDAAFAKDIVESTGAEIFVQDGFGVIHRAHASTDAIARLLPAVAGLLLEKEVSTLTKTLESPEHPFYVLIGGAKVEDKEPLITKFVGVADEIWVGGKIAADGYTAPEAVEGGTPIRVARTFAEDRDGNKLDISAAAAAELAEIIEKEAATVLWSGTFGKVEEPEFAKGSEIIARTIGEKEGLTSVICGGDTTAFVESLMKKDPGLHYSLISTGGGATLALLTGEELPGISALSALDDSPQDVV